MLLTLGLEGLLLPGVLPCVLLELCLATQLGRCCIDTEQPERQTIVP
jgi:hypothetical protein